MMMNEDDKKLEDAYRDIEGWEDGSEKESKYEDESILVGEPIIWSNIKEDEGHRDWLWENFIAKGNITLLSALAKAGKTTLLRSLFVAMKNNEEFAGQPTRKANVLVLSEESSAEWADTREGIDDKDIDHVLIWTRPTRGIPTKKEWSQIIAGVSEKCTELKIDMVVVDTISTFWPVDNENDASMVKRSLVPLFKLTEENGVALVIVHHFKKGGGTEGTASRGSSALVGHVDNIVEFRRAQDGFPNQRSLKVMGRFVQETEVIIELNTEGKYDTKGEPWQVSKSARLEKMLQTIGESPSALTAKELYSLLSASIQPLSLRTVQRYLRELLEKELVKESGTKTVAGKNMPIYTQTGWIESSRDKPNTPTQIPVAADSKTKTVAATVAARQQISLASRDTTGISPIRENTVAGVDFAENNPFLDGVEAKSAATSAEKTVAATVAGTVAGKFRGKNPPKELL